jgi:chaperonin GroES
MKNHDAFGISPLADRIIVRPEVAQTTTKSGIIMSEPKQEGVKTGSVVAVGPGQKDTSGTCIAMNIAVGDRVLYNAYAGDSIIHEGADYIILREDSVVARINKEI